MQFWFYVLIFILNVSWTLQVTTFADMEGEETFDATFLGHADEVVEERIADDDVILIKGTKNSSAVSGLFLHISCEFPASWNFIVRLLLYINQGSICTRSL